MTLEPFMHLVLSFFLQFLVQTVKTSNKECVLSEGNICVCMGLPESFKAMCSQSCKLLVTELRLKIQIQQSILKQNPWCKFFLLFILP